MEKGCTCRWDGNCKRKDNQDRETHVFFSSLVTPVISGADTAEYGVTCLTKKTLQTELLGKREEITKCLDRFDTQQFSSISKSALSHSTLSRIGSY